MKKIYLSVVVMTGLFSSVSFARNGVALEAIAGVQDTVLTDTVVKKDTIVKADTAVAGYQSLAGEPTEYQPIDAKDLPEAIQAVLLKDYAGYSFKSAAVKTDEQGVKIYKVVLVNGEGADTELLFNEKGEIQQNPEVKSDTETTGYQSLAGEPTEYQPIDAKDLPEAIQAVLLKDYAGYSFKSAAVKTDEQGVKTYKVVLVNSEGADTELLFNEKGEIQQNPEVKSDTDTTGYQTLAGEPTEYQPIDARDLPEAVQAVLQKDYARYSFKEAAVKTDEQGEKIYKVVLVDEEGIDTEVLFNEKGEILK